MANLLFIAFESRLPGGMGGRETLSEIELRILRLITKTRQIKDLSKLADVPPATLGQAVARLQLGGYITGDCRLTEKGDDAVKRS